MISSCDVSYLFWVSKTHVLYPPIVLMLPSSAPHPSLHILLLTLHHCNRSKARLFFSTIHTPSVLVSLLSVPSHDRLLNSLSPPLMTASLPLFPPQLPHSPYSWYNPSIGSLKHRWAGTYRHTGVISGVFVCALTNEDAFSTPPVLIGHWHWPIQCEFLTKQGAAFVQTFIFKQAEAH